MQSKDLFKNRGQECLVLRFNNISKKQDLSVSGVGFITALIDNVVNVGDKYMFEIYSVFKDCKNNGLDLRKGNFEKDVYYRVSNFLTCFDYKKLFLYELSKLKSGSMVTIIYKNMAVYNYEKKELNDVNVVLSVEECKEDYEEILLGNMIFIPLKAPSSNVRIRHRLIKAFLLAKEQRENLLFYEKGRIF